MAYRAYVAVEQHNPFLKLNLSMGIFKVLGLGLAIVIIRFLVPEIFAALEDTFLLFFDTIQTVLVKAQSGPNSASLIQLLPR